MTADAQAGGAIRLSICIPTYNFGAFIGETLESILPQVVEGVEVVILDGGSTDETPEVVRSFQERFPELRYERRAERGGIDRDLARTIDLAQGEYCWLFCSDDVMKPGAVDRMLEHIRSQLDVYVCGFTLCTRDMRPIADQSVVALASDADFDLGLAGDRRRYFERAQTTPAFFSFAGALIVRKARWDSRVLDEAFVGSCWAHVARLFAMIPDGLRLGYLATSYLYKRTDNDSFMDSGLVRRYALTIDGYHRLAHTFFGEQSLEARHIRRVVRNEFPPWILLHAKSEARKGSREELPLLDRLVAKAFADPSLGNRMKHLAYRFTPLVAYRWGRASYRALKSARPTPAHAREGLGVHVLMVSPFPPTRGGIATYADQVVTSLRARGHRVTVASPEPSYAEHVLDVTTPGAGRAFSRLARGCDLLVVQYQPEMLGPPGSTFRTRGMSLLRLSAGLRAAPASELCVHEVNYGDGPYAPLLRRLVRPLWQLADEVTVHTEWERREFADAFAISTDRIRVVRHGEHLLRRTDEDRAAARAALGVPAEQVVLLAIGFLQPNKGFDRAMRAFAALGKNDAARLYVVGSIWREDPTSLAHLDELRRLAADTPGAELREGYVGDEDFDRWIVAADTLVLPYRLIWSSSVMERGLLYDRPVILSRVGGIAEQGSGRRGVTLVDDDDELVDALRRMVNGPPHDRVDERQAEGSS